LAATPSIPDEPPAQLTPTQQNLDHRLRAWRTTEAERLGLPQFFVLGTSTLRNIAIVQPQTLAELKTIDGLSLEKLERFGPGILEVCNTQ
jgi:ATP-dependent DNA helicase RecQ